MSPTSRLIIIIATVAVVVFIVLFLLLVGLTRCWLSHKNPAGGFIIIIIAMVLFLYMHMIFVTGNAAKIESIEMHRCDAYEEVSRPHQGALAMEDNPAYATFIINR